MHTDSRLKDSDSSRKPPLDVHLYVTNACNLSCSHCYYEAVHLRQNEHRRQLSTAVIEHVLRCLQQEYETDIHLEGGEPFLHPGMYELLELATPTLWGNVTFTSNGAVPLDSVAKKLRAASVVRISLEGHTDELQQKVRDIPVSKVMATCRGLLSAGVDVLLRITLFRHSVAHLEEMFQTFLNWGFTRFSVFECQLAGRAEGELQQLTADQLRKSIDALTSVATDSRIHALTLNLGDNRKVWLQSQRERLAVAGVTVRDLLQRPNLTVNADGGLGVSPWNITAMGQTDRFADYHPDTFCDDVAKAYAAGQLLNPTPHDSIVQLQF
jgi:molybdenum cofactor biosynthesis enzyme MoaA